MFFFIALLQSSMAFLPPPASGQKFEDTLGKIRPSASVEEQERAAEGVVERLLGPTEAQLFRIRVQPELAQEGRDLFKLKTVDGKLEVTGSSGVAATWGVHHYLKYNCRSHISWDGDRIEIPRPLPSANLTHRANDRFRYYQNVCTTSYSFVWWGWARWEREVDWMALNGINLALAFTAQEEVWSRVYLDLGLTQNEIDQHFTGPAFLAWGRMGNIRGWGGPLSDAWKKGSVELQLKTLERMRSLGITPVLPAFAGQVPRAFDRLFPTANLTKLPVWNEFPEEYNSPYLLLPTDPLFQRVGALFLKEYISMFGTDHIYNCDTFNEMVPNSGDPAYLKLIGESIYSAMAAVDPSAIWMLQGWIFINEKYFWTNERAEALMTSIPLGKMLILDLQSELNPQYTRLDSYFGQPYIWCMLHNFGGTLGLHGASRSVNREVFKARSEADSTMVGIGLTPEGINQNYVMYDLMLEMGWRKKPVNLTKWFRKYASRRYGHQSALTGRAWELLKDSVYNYQGTLPQHGRYILVHRPNLKLSPEIWYDPRDVFRAWGALVQESSSNQSFPATFLYDLADLSRQSLQLRIDQIYADIIRAYSQNNTQILKSLSNQFLSIMDDLDEILGSHEAFLLGRWLEAAKAAGTTQEEIQSYERNARNQITMWGPKGQILDYASKQWSGLILDYYKPRWQIFLEALIGSLEGKTKFNQDQVNNLFFSKVEYPFTYSTKLYSIKPKGDPIMLANKLYDKWIPK